MRKILSVVLISTLLFLSATAIFATEPQNLCVAKQVVIKYHDSGEYNHDCAKIIARAQNYLEKRIGQNYKNQKLAIVFDIDDTSISDYPALANLDFSYKFDLLEKYHKKSNYPVIPETLKLYRYAKDHGMAVFFITGRGNELKEATIKNLKVAGYKNWNKIYFRPSNYHVTPYSIAPFKTYTRKSIIAEGYVIVLNIGDQNSDLAGGYAERVFKLPNPFYCTT